LHIAFFCIEPAWAIINGIPFI